MVRSPTEHTVQSTASSTHRLPTDDADRPIKILCVSDEVDRLVYSENIKQRYQDIDLVLSAGDLPMDYLGYIASNLNVPILFVFGNHNLKRFEQFKYTHRLGHGISHRAFSNLRSVSQEYDTASHKDEIIFRSFGSVYIGGKIHRFKSLIIVGMGGSIRYNKGRNQYTQWQMYLKLFALVPRLWLNKLIHGRFVDILLTHSPPFELNDGDDKPHIGFKAFRWFMRKFSPQYLLHGHIHLYDINAPRTIIYDNTHIINVFSKYLLEVNARRHAQKQ